MKIVKLKNKAIAEATEFLNNGGVVIFPTDTVYGFLADAANKKAVDKIYKIKKRVRSKPLPFFITDIKTAKEVAEINSNQEKMLRAKWPGKYTFVLCKKNSKDTVALRIPKYKFLNDLLRKIGKPLAQTSVNISGKPPLVKIGDIISQFGQKDILVIGAGNLRKSKPSKIIDLTKDKIKILR